MTMPAVELLYEPVAVYRAVVANADWAKGYSVAKCRSRVENKSRRAA